MFIISQTQRKVSSARSEFDKINEHLMSELPQLYERRVDLFEPCLKAMMSSKVSQCPILLNLLPENGFSPFVCVCLTFFLYSSSCLSPHYSNFSNESSSFVCSCSKMYLSLPFFLQLLYHQSCADSLRQCINQLKSRETGMEGEEEVASNNDTPTLDEIFSQIKSLSIVGES